MCGYHHCDRDRLWISKEDNLWGVYTDTPSNCSMCQKKCDLDDNCAGVECDYFDDRYCSWWNDLNCGTVEERIYSLSYKTCVKPRKSNDNTGKDY